MWSKQHQLTKDCSHERYKLGLSSSVIVIHRRKNENLQATDTIALRRHHLKNIELGRTVTTLIFSLSLRHPFFTMTCTSRKYLSLQWSFCGWIHPFHPNLLILSEKGSQAESQRPRGESRHLPCDTTRTQRGRSALITEKIKMWKKGTRQSCRAWRRALHF